MGRFAIATIVISIIGLVGSAALAIESADNGGLFVLAQNNAIISDGTCRCKRLCDAGNNPSFSAGRTVQQCKRQCEVSFSGCKRGEVRSKVRRY